MQWITNDDIDNISKRLPATYLAGITKMENSKNRILLTADTPHYYIG